MEGDSREVPQSFYQYWPIDTVERREWLERLIRRKEIYFRERTQLNDPNELRPSLVLRGGNALLRKYVRELMQNYWSGPKLSPAKRLIEETRLMEKYRRDPEQLRNTLHELLDKVGVLCLSASATVPLLWAHYAAGHRGICVEFDANCGLFLAAQRVIYSGSAPEINRLTDSRDAMLQKSMFYKSSEWSYEQEWRVIARWRDEDRIAQYLATRQTPAPLRDFVQAQHGPGYYTIPPNALKAVILGSRTSDEHAAWIRTLLEEAAATVAVGRATLSPDGSIAAVLGRGNSKLRATEEDTTPIRLGLSRPTSNSISPTPRAQLLSSGIR